MNVLGLDRVTAVGLQKQMGVIKEVLAFSLKENIG